MQSGAADDLWAVTTYFDFAGCRFRRRNYDVFRRHLAVPLLAIEYAPDGNFSLSSNDADILCQISGGDVMWQKERLLNLAINRLPDNCRYVAWMDCDVVFLAQEWSRQVVTMLEEIRLVQVFGDLFHLRDSADPLAFAPTDVVMQQRSTVAGVADGKNPAECVTTNRVSGSCAQGLAWAARRELMQSSGFYDRCIIGGGDSALACAAYGCFERTEQLHAMNVAQRAAYRSWAEPFRRQVDAQIGFLDVPLVHLWHGTMASRQAGDRHVGLGAFDFRPNADLALSPDGCWNWATEKPDLHHYVQQYFATRSQGGDSSSPL